MAKLSSINKANGILEEFYNLFYKIEDMALKRGIKCLTQTELHIIDSIGEETNLTMNALSNKLGITMGTATVAITKLVQKGFIERNKYPDKDRRKVLVSLTKKGGKALEYHKNYHKMLMTSITENINSKDLEHFVKVFEELLEALKIKSDYFQPLQITDFPKDSKVSIVEIKGTPIVQKYFSSQGIDNFSVVKIIENKNKFKIEKSDGGIIELDILDAKNLIGTKVE